MNKSEIIAEVAARTEWNRKEEAGAVDVVFEAVTEALVRRQKFRTAGFGHFATRSQTDRTGRNPREPANVGVTS